MVVMYGLMMVGMTVDVGVCLALTHIAPQKQATPQASDEQARDAPQPGGTDAQGRRSVRDRASLHRAGTLLQYG